MSLTGGREKPLAASLTGLDVEGFDDWVAPHLPVLLAIAVREVRRDAAEDVVQETLVRAWQRRSTFDAAKGSARAWLVAILFDRARRHRVRRGDARPVADEAVELAAGVAGDTERRLDIEAAVRSLPRRQRQLVTLHYLADLPVAEVAVVLGISAGAVKAQLSDARQQLKTVLEGHDG